MICVVLYAFLSFFKPLFYLVAALVMGLAAALAYGNYGDQHPEKIFLSAISTFTTPRKRIWKRVVDERELKEASGIGSGEPQKAGVELAAKKPAVDFDRLSKIIDTGSFADEEVKGRVASLGKKEKIPENVVPKDAIAINTNEAQGVDSLLSKFSKTAKKSEPLISQLASISPAKLFKYDQVDTSGALQEPIQEVAKGDSK
jgi:hypothetical protein